MSKRLGDDPLIRARDARAKAEQAMTAVTADSEGQVTSKPAFRSSSRSSYNDVFFKRRAEANAPQQAADITEAPEISEISELPEIREVAAAPSLQSETRASVNAGAAGPLVTEVLQVPSVSIIAEVVAKLNASAVTTSAPVDAVHEVTPGPVGLPTSQAPNVSNDAPQKSGGFFKRIFGRFGK